MNSNRVTQEQIDAIVENTVFHISKMLDKCTVVTAELPNGFIIVESSACVDPANYDHMIGTEICKKRIIDQIWKLEGYKLQSAQGQRDITTLRDNWFQALEDNPDRTIMVMAIKLPSGAIEVITNTQDLSSKINYYINNYDSSFRLKANPEVQVVNFMVV